MHTLLVRREHPGFFLENIPIAEMCKAATWSTPLTFTKQYCVDVLGIHQANAGQAVLCTLFKTTAIPTLYQRLLGGSALHSVQSMCIYHHECYRTDCYLPCKHQFVACSAVSHPPAGKQSNKGVSPRGGGGVTLPRDSTEFFREKRRCPTLDGGSMRSM